MTSNPFVDRASRGFEKQAAEAIRKDGHPRWMQLTGLIHDLGKVMWIWENRQ